MAKHKMSTWWLLVVMLPILGGYVGCVVANHRSRLQVAKRHPYLGLNCNLLMDDFFLKRRVSTGGQRITFQTDTDEEAAFVLRHFSSHSIEIQSPHITAKTLKLLGDVLDVTIRSTATGLSSPDLRFLPKCVDLLSIESDRFDGSGIRHLGRMQLVKISSSGLADRHIKKSLIELKRRGEGCPELYFEGEFLTDNLLTDLEVPGRCVICLANECVNVSKETVDAAQKKGLPVRHARYPRPWDPYHYVE